MGFQITPAASTFAIGIAGDFAAHNPRFTVLAGPGALVAGAAGVFVGRFAWLSYSFLDPDNAPVLANSFGSGPVNGFVGLASATPQNTTYLSDSSMLVRPGQMLTLFSGGDFLVVNSGTNQVLPGMVAYANYSTGLVNFATGASAASTATAATSAIAAGTFSGFTGSLSGNILTITAAGTGSIYPGATLTAGGAATGSMITAQLTSTVTGGALATLGTYSVSISEQAVASNSSWGGTYGILTLGATPSAAFPIGGLLSGTSVVAGTFIGAYITGNGAANGNTIAVSNNTVVASTTITTTLNVATKWLAMSGGGAGEIIKMSSQALG